MTTEYSKGLKFESNNDGTCNLIGIGTCTDTNIIIPPISPDGEKVIKIDDNAFYFDMIIDEYFCMYNGLDFSILDDNIESITIPEGVVSIGCGAFQNRRLKAINFPSTLIHIGSECCSDCCNLSSINIPNVKTIEKYAFFNCDNLKDVTLPSVTYIGDFAFCNCPKLTNIQIPSTTSLGEEPFDNMD